MDAHAYDSIAQFCVEQYGKFDAQAWKRRGVADRKLVAIAAKYLSMTSWFGHEDQLERIIAEIDASLASSAEFNRELDSIGFDLVLFSSAVRCGIATRKVPPVQPQRLREPLPARRPHVWPAARL
jgi:hypothetical protein